MSKLMNEFEDHVLNALFNNTAVAAMANIYLSLHTGDPGETDASAAANEVSGNNYGRTAITFGASSSGTVTQDNTVTFPAPSGSWGTVTHWGVWDASSGGNCIVSGPFTTSMAPASGLGVIIPSGTISISID